MKTSFKIDFQLFAEKWSDEEVELFQSLGLDADGNPIAEGNDEDNPMDPLDINEGDTVTPDLNPDNLSASSEGAETPEAPVVPEDDSLSSQEEPAFTEQTPLILGKFKNQAELERAYLELQNRFGKQSNEIGEIRRMLSHPPDENASSDNGGLFSDIPKEQLMESFAADPHKFLKGIIEIAGTETLEKAKEAIRAETQREKFLEEFFGQNSDFSELRDSFIEISEQVKDPQIALNAVRGMKLGQLDNLFSDTSYLEKHLDSPGMKAIFSDVSVVERLSDKVKQKIIDNYLKKAKESRSNVNLISNDAGSLPKTPPKTYRNFNDMTEDAVSFLKELNKK